MKRVAIFSVLFFVFISQSLFAVYSLTVQDPKNTWKSSKGNIDSASLIVSPQGNYCLYDLYLIFSSKGSQYTNLTDTLEIQYFFELNKDAIVTDSWLWVEDTLVKAKLIDRWTASQIYEGIVQRRRDPSIFFKNSPTQYEFRVFPMAGSKTRKVKISWLEPINWNSYETPILFPTLMFSKSITKTKIHLTVLKNDTWKNPRLSFEDKLNPGDIKEVNDPIYGPTLQVDFNNFNLQFQNKYYIYYDNPMKDGVFLKTYMDKSNENFFEFTILPQTAFDLTIPKSIMFIVDFDLNSKRYEYADIIQMLKQSVLSKFSPKDSFNLIISNFSMKPLSDKWLPATQENIENIFEMAKTKPITLYSLLPQLLLEAKNFAVNNHSDFTNIGVISTSENFGNFEIANQIIKTLRADTNRIPPLYFLDFSRHQTSNYINGQYFSGNEYLYSNLAKITGGELLGKGLVLADGIELFTNNFNAKFLDLEIQTNFDQGFCYSKYYLSSPPSLSISSPVSILGKFFGDGKFSCNLTGIVKSEKPYLVRKTIEVDTYETGSKYTKRAWLGKYIQNLENSTKDNATVAEIIETSMENRILSLYTAFLALEPWMTGDNNSQDDNDDDNGNTSVDYSDTEIKLTAYPNPFSKVINLSISLMEKFSSVYEISIYNTAGDLVKTLDLTEFLKLDSMTLQWDGTDNYGNLVSNGIYLIVIKTTNETKTLKVILNR